MRQSLALLITLLILFTSLLFGLSDRELAISINLSGKQRMLTQKMTKEALLIRSNIDKKVNIDRLKESSRLFNKTLKGLIGGDKSLKLVSIEDNNIQKELKKIEKLWKPFHSEIENVIFNRATDNTYKLLEKNNIPLLNEMNIAVNMYTLEKRGENKFKLANDINLAGKQRMLTQKMAKDLLFIKNGFKKEYYISDFKKSQKLFTKILNGLFNGDKKLNLEGTKIVQIVKQLRVVDKLWINLQPILKKSLNGKDIKSAIDGLDNILIEMNRAVLLYTKAFNRQKQRLELSYIINSFINKNNQLKRLVNLSGKQRMLTQRMAKLSLLISSNIDKKENIKRLIKFSSLYNQTLKAFRDGDRELNCIPLKSKLIDEQIAVIEKKWKPFYKNIKNIINQKDGRGKSLRFIIDNNEELLEVSNELVKRYEKSNRSQNYLDKTRLRIVNVAGRERMLTQKMTKEKLLILNGDNKYKSKLQKTIKLFNDSLNVLISGDSNQTIVKPTNKKIKEQLAKVLSIWMKLKPLYLKDNLSSKEMNIIIKKNPILLYEMNRMVKMSEVEVEY